MRRMRLALVAALFVSACGYTDPPPVGPTPYQPYVAHGGPGVTPGGYTSQKLAQGLYLVTFRGTVASTQESVIGFAYRRAAEVCGGDDAFTIAREEDVSRVDETDEVRAGIFGGGGWASARARSWRERTVWPRRRLTVQCHEK